MTTSSRRALSEAKSIIEKKYYLVQNVAEDNTFSNVSSCQIFISNKDNTKGKVKYENVNYNVKILKSVTLEEIEAKAKK